MPNLRLLACAIAILLAAACSRSGTPTAGQTGNAPAAAATGAAPPAAPKAIREVPQQWQSRVPEIAPADVPRTLRTADNALANGQLERGNAPGPGALELYLAVIAADPGNQQAQDGVVAVLDALFERGRIAMRSGDFDLARHIESIARAVQPDHRDFADYRRRLAQAVAEHEARTQARTLLDDAWKQAGAGDFVAADRLWGEADRLTPQSPAVRVMGLRIVELRQSRTASVIARANKAVDRLQLERADALLAELARIAAQKITVEKLRQRIHIARHYGPFHPSEQFSERLRSGGRGPEMVTIRYGNFDMGSDGSDPAAQANERPRHVVVFKRGFAIARTEVTVGEFRRFVAATGYRSVATRAGKSIVYDVKGGVFTEHNGVDWRQDHFGREAAPELPVVHVAFEDAQAYARWLSAQTGADYRLPTEAEFEYVLRAGGRSLYPWGNAAPRALVANLAGDGDLSPTGRRWGNAVPHYRDAFWGLSPAGTFPEEAFGTYDTIGNAAEWTLDCWHDSYQRAPVDGSAWINPGCDRRVVRGAAWDSGLDRARSAAREGEDAATTSARIGFRVVRVL